MTLRWKLAAPLALAMLLTLAAAMTAESAGAWPWALAAMAMLTLSWTLLEFSVHRPLQLLLARLRGLLSAGADDTPAASELSTLANGVDSLAARLVRAEACSAREAQARAEQGEELRGLRERYVMAVDRATDGVWECDLASGQIEFSARWRGMLGYGEDAPPTRTQWEALVHPDDRDAVRMSLQNHLAGLTPCFDAQYRLRNARGEYRWMQSRGSAIRHASGKPYRFVAMDNDIHARKTLEDTLVHAAEGLSDVSGDAFLRTLVTTLSSILGTRDNLVACYLDDPPTRAHTLVYLSRGVFHDPFEYELAGTSCGAVVERGQTVYCPTGVCEIWPSEKEFDRDSYIGVPMFDRNGRVIGHFACMDGKPMAQDLPHLAIFKIFAVRAAAELERMQLSDRLMALQHASDNPA